MLWKANKRKRRELVETLPKKGQQIVLLGQSASQQFPIHRWHDKKSFLLLLMCHYFTTSSSIIYTETKQNRPSFLTADCYRGGDLQREFFWKSICLWPPSTRSYFPLAYSSLPFFVKSKLCRLSDKFLRCFCSKMKKTQIFAYFRFNQVLNFYF